MIKIFYKLCILIFFALSGCSQDKLQDANHHIVHLKDYKNKWLIFNYWATWCTPCRREIPVFNTLYEKYANKIGLFAINFDGLQNDALKKAILVAGIQYPSLIEDPKNIFHLPEMTVVPTTFLISPDRSKTIVLLGPQTLKNLEEKIKK